MCIDQIDFLAIFLSKLLIFSPALFVRIPVSHPYVRTVLVNIL